MTDSKKQNQNNSEQSPVSVEFLVDTLAGLRSALTSIEKESSDKTDAVYEISETLKIFTEHLKSINRRTVKTEERLEKIESAVKALGTYIEASNAIQDKFFDTVQDGLGDHLKEIKYAIQELNKAVLKEKSKKVEEPKKKKKQSWGKWIIELARGIKNLNNIVIILFLILLILLFVFLGSDAVDVILGIVRKII